MVIFVEVSIVMEDPQMDSFLCGQSYENGWELGLPLFQETWKYVSIGQSFRKKLSKPHVFFRWTPYVYDRLQYT